MNNNTSHSSADEIKAAEAVYAHLRHERVSEAPLPEEATLARRLQSLAEDNPAAPAFKAALEDRLRLEQARLSAGPAANPASGWRRTLATARPFAWAGLAVLLIFSLGWVIRNLLPPRPVAPAASNAETPASVLPLQDSATPGALAPTLAAPAGDPATATPLPPSQSFESPLLFPGTTLVLSAGFPEAPAQMTIYTQTVSTQPLTPEGVSQIGAQLGMDGKVYRLQSSPEQGNLYLVSDGWDRVGFYNGSLDQFYYRAGFANTLDSGASPLPFEQQAAIAEEFLRSHGLLDFPYYTEPTFLAEDTVRFVYMLDGLPVRYSRYDTPLIEVQISPDGRVMAVSYTRLAFKDLGEFPIRSAQAAWDQIVNGQSTTGIQTSSRAMITHNLETWYRHYPSGQRIDLYGYPEIIPAAEGREDPLVTLNSLPLTGDLQSFARQTPANGFMHVWGKVVDGDGDRQSLQLEGWEPSPLPDESFQGAIQQGDSSLHMNDGQVLALPDLPDSIPDGSPALVRGVKVDEGGLAIDWTTIQVGEPGGGGGGGEVETFAPLDLNPKAQAGGEPSLAGPTATPLPTDIPPNPLPARLDGEAGTITTIIYAGQDGPGSTEFFILVPTSPALPDGLYARLSGAGLEALAGLNRLPVKVWGEVRQEADGAVTVAVERWEEAYPGLALQAWLGTMEPATLEGQEAVLFTDQDGQQYALFSPIGLPETIVTGQSGDSLIVEGFVDPDKAFSGHPVLFYFSASPSGGRQNLDGYTLDSAAPIELQGRPQPSTPAQATVESIELVYHVADNRGLPPGDIAQPAYAQPVWRFTGHYDDGREFEILVQALDNAYLK